jgi:hypothetical protein
MFGSDDEVEGPDFLREPMHCGHLAAIHYAGMVKCIDNDPVVIRETVEGNFDFIPMNRKIGFFVNDEGLLTRKPLNVVASLYGGKQPVWGHVVMSGPMGADGKVSSPPGMLFLMLRSLAGRYEQLIDRCVAMGQIEPFYRGDPDRLPKAVIGDIPDDWLNH